MDPYADPEVARSVLTWALSIAKSEGATNAREALDSIRFTPTSDDAWNFHRSNVEFLWKSL